MNFLQSNRPRKLMATAALSVPLLAAGLNGAVQQCSFGGRHL